MTGIDIYNRKRFSIENEQLMLDNSSLDVYTKSKIQEFNTHLTARGVQVMRRIKLMKQCRLMFEQLICQSVLEMDANSIENALAKIASFNFKRKIKIGSNKKGKDTPCKYKWVSKEWSYDTKKDYRRLIKQFFGWYCEKYENEQTNKIKKAIASKVVINLKNKERLQLRSDIIEEEDKNLLISKGCKNAKEKAFISLLHEMGYRIGEILGIKIKDIERLGDKAKIQVTGKTGTRCPSTYVAYPYLSQWLDVHPYKDDRNAYLWTLDNENFRKNKQENCLSYIGAIRLINRVSKRAKFTKPCNPHWFRHSRATLNSRFMREVPLCRFMGWEIGSKQASTYCKTNDNDVDDIVEQQLGKKTKEQVQMHINCSTCGITNDKNSKFCSRCGRALTLQSAIQGEEEIQRQIAERVTKMMETMLKNPEKRNEWLKIKVE